VTARVPTIVAGPGAGARAADRRGRRRLVVGAGVALASTLGVAAVVAGPRAWRAAAAGIAAVGAGAGPAAAGAGDAPEGELCVVAPLQPWDRASGIAIHAPRPVPDDARCPVCGMFPARAPERAAQVIFADGDTHFLDSPLSLHRYLGEVARHARGRDAASIAARWLRVADAPGWHDPARVAYAAGGTWRTPMGPGQPTAFADPDAAARLVAAQGGRVLVAQAMTPEALDAFDARRTHRH
jgi:nitrous oxide reductase accessory protein NosL